MIVLTSARQARAMANVIPAVAVQRMVALEGNDQKYDPNEHGKIIVLTEGDKISELEGFGFEWPDEESVSAFEYVFISWENGQRIFEATVPLAGDAMLILIVPDRAWVCRKLRQILLAEAVEEG